MLHLVQSNKMEVLAEQLLKLMAATCQQGSLFDEDTILVQSPGMAQWLKLQLAEQTGLAANVAFPLPSSFIWNLYRQHVPELPERSAFTKENMTWKLMSVLPQQLGDPAFAAISQYLQDADPVKQYQLCHKIADIYDQYLVYRPDWMTAWEQGCDQLDDTDVSLHPWQPILWRKLVEFTQELGESPWHRANLHQRLLNALGQIDGDKDASKPLFVFGLSAMPIQQLEVLSALSQSRDVVIFWFNPSETYWGDIIDTKTLARLELKFLQGRVVKGEIDTSIDANDETLLTAPVGNPLLASWGKLGRDYQDLLVSMEVGQFDAFVEFEPEHLLGQIQADILHLSYRGSSEPLPPEELLTNGINFPKLPVAANDRSLQVHSCHSKVRELEVLHDQLLHLFNADPSLTPGDIIVMMPDVASYAPVIDGVFGSSAQGLSIPYAISDRNAGEASPLLSSFDQMLRLHQSRLALSDVLALFEVPAVQRKFELSEGEFELLSHWLSEAGIRWGWDENDKTRWQVPGEQQNTWLFGLRRLLAGYAMGQSDYFDSALGHIAPYVEIEGQQAVALGKFYLFAKVLTDALAGCQQSGSLTEKVAQARVLIERLYEPDDQEQRDMLQLRQVLEELEKHQHQFTGVVTQDVFAAEVSSRLTEKGVGQRFLAGFVNFCTLMPMRSIPFKVVCILGLNDGDYPRQVTPLGFDLMRGARGRKGDRSRRLDDRYLFLEAILSARDVLYLSYQGKSAKDNSQRTPSLLLSELLDYCAQGFALEGTESIDAKDTAKALLKHLQIEHPLQPFADSYYLPADKADGVKAGFEPRWLTLLQRQAQPVAPALFSPATPLPDTLGDEKIELQLESLIRFFHNPAKGFFQNRWQVSFPGLQDGQQEHEPFAIDGLARYQLNDRWLQDTQTDDAQSAHYWQSQLKAEGKLPLANSGPIKLKKLSKEFEALRASVEEAIAGKRQHSVAVLYEDKNLLLAGRVHGAFDRDLILWRPGKVRAKDRLTLWLNWLALCALTSEHQWQQAQFIGTDGNAVLNRVEPDVALRTLQQWLAAWQRGILQPLCFFPEAGWSWVTVQDVLKTLKLWAGSDFASGEGQDLHIHRIYPDLSQVFELFASEAEQLLQPIQAYTQMKEKAKGAKA